MRTRWRWKAAVKAVSHTINYNILTEVTEALEIIFSLRLSREEAETHPSAFRDQTGKSETFVFLSQPLQSLCSVSVSDGQMSKMLTACSHFSRSRIYMKLLLFFYGFKRNLKKNLQVMELLQIKFKFAKSSHQSLPLFEVLPSCRVFFFLPCQYISEVVEYQETRVSYFHSF